MALDLFPADCFSRTELHDILQRANRAASAASGEVALALRSLCGAVAMLDGILDEMTANNDKAVLLHAHVFVNDKNIKHRWVGSRYSTHSERGHIQVTVEQMLLVVPVQGGASSYVATNRYRAILGSRQRTAATLEELRPLVEGYFDKFRDHLPDGVADHMAEHLLGLVVTAAATQERVDRE